MPFRDSGSSIGTHFRYRIRRHSILIDPPRNAIKSRRMSNRSNRRLLYDRKNREARSRSREVGEIKFSSFVTGIQAIGDYRSNTRTRGIPVYTSAKSRRIRRWLKRLT